MSAVVKSFGSFLVELLEYYDVETIFGIPGVHTAELYRGLARSKIEHLATRHEQGAGFAADGYARVSGKPGVCLVITGPGLTNILTAMGQAYADSIPMLVISGVNARHEIGLGNGFLHESPNQSQMAEQVSAFSHTLLSIDEIMPVMARVFSVFSSARPRPVHIEVPLDLMQKNAEHLTIPTHKLCLKPPQAPTDQLNATLHMLSSAVRPLIIVGGGAKSVGTAITDLAEYFNTPVVTTINARGVIHNSHPLAVNCSPSTQPIRDLIKSSDVILAIATELAPTDFDIYCEAALDVPGELIRVDISAQQLVRNCYPKLAILGEAKGFVAELLAIAKETATKPTSYNKEALLSGEVRAEQARIAVLKGESAEYQNTVKILEFIKQVLPQAILVGDSTQPIYAGNNVTPSGTAGSWFNSSVGFGSLGYALPAAIGASLAAPNKPVVCIVGDGGLQFSMGELGTAIDAQTPIIVLVWNNSGYGEIKSYMLSENIEPEGVDLYTPDFANIGLAYGYDPVHVTNYAELEKSLRDAVNHKRHTFLLGVESL